MKPVRMLAALVLAAAGLGAQAVPSAQAMSVKGEVLETRNVDSYTYLRLKTTEGEMWAAVPTATVKTGAVVTVGNAMLMENFESKTLKKKFDKIVFGEIIGPDTKAASPHGASAPAGPAGPASAPVAPVAKAAGPDAKTVAELFKGKAALKDKTVSVRGQVMKVNLGILGKNWFHLQDGSGKAADGTNDVVVTTQDVVARGDIVTVKGTVHTDVNLGAGYAYSVLIENATVSK